MYQHPRRRQRRVESVERWGRLICGKVQLEEIDDSVCHRTVGEEGDDAHLKGGHIAFHHAALPMRKKNVFIRLNI